MKLNGVKVDVDFLDLETARRYEEGVKKIEEFVRKNKDVKCSLSEAIEANCDAIIEFLDHVIGEGTAAKVFGGKTNLRTCTEVYGQLSDELNRQAKSAGTILRRESAD